MTTEAIDERAQWLPITKNTDIENSFRKTVNKAKHQQEETEMTIKLYEVILFPGSPIILKIFNFQ